MIEEVTLEKRRECDIIIADFLKYRGESKTLLLQHCRYFDQFNWQAIVYHNICKEIRQYLISSREEDEEEVMYYFNSRIKFEEYFCQNRPLQTYFLIVEMIEWYNVRIQKVINNK